MHDAALANDGRACDDELPGRDLMRGKRHSKKSKKRTVQPSLTHLFAARLRELRTLKQLTLDDVVALGAGGSGGRLSHLERGAVSPTLRTLEEIARALDVDPLDLIVDPRIDLRHRLISGSADAKPATLEAALSVLDPEQRQVPTARTVRQRAAALPVWAQRAVRQAARTLLHDANAGFAEAMLELNDAELRAADAVVEALERVLRAASGHQRDSARGRSTRRRRDQAS